jgi:hypothetical protein
MASLFDETKHITLTLRLDPETRYFLERIMSTVTDALTAAVADLTASTNNLGTQVQATGQEIASLKAGPDEGVITAATTAVQTATAAVNSAISTLAAD